MLKATKAVIFLYVQSTETVNCCQTGSLALLSFLDIDVEAQSIKLMLFNTQSQDLRQEEARKCRVKKEGSQLCGHTGLLIQPPKFWPEMWQGKKYSFSGSFQLIRLMVTFQQNKVLKEKKKTNKKTPTKTLDRVLFLIPLYLLFPADLSSRAGFPVIGANWVVNSNFYISKFSKLLQSS